MTTAREVTVVVIDITKHSGHGWVPEKLEDAVQFFSDMLGLVPKEYRHSATLELDSSTSYDCDYPTIRIEYQRPETKEETAARVADEEKDRASKESREREQYERLAEKYGPTNLRHMLEDAAVAVEDGKAIPAAYTVPTGRGRWRGMKTAPKDGRPIETNVGLNWWDGQYWHIKAPTRWRPLPISPDMPKNIFRKQS